MDNKNTDCSIKSVIFARPYSSQLHGNHPPVSNRYDRITQKTKVRMAQSSKASIKRGKPSYFMSILGVTLVLFFLGIIGWLVINANKLGNHFKENVSISA